MLDCVSSLILVFIVTLLEVAQVVILEPLGRSDKTVVIFGVLYCGKEVHIILFIPLIIQTAILRINVGDADE